MAFLHAASIVGFSLGIALIIDGVIQGQSWGELSGATWLFVGSVFARGTTLVAVNALGQSGGALIKSELRRRGLGALSRLGPENLRGKSSVEVTTLLAQGIDALDSYFGRYIPQLLLAAIQTPVLLVVLWVTDIPTGLAITIVLPLIPVFMVLIGLVTRTIQKRQWDALQELGQAFVEIVDGLSTLKIFGRHWRQVSRIRQVTDDFRKKTMAVLRVSFLSSFVLELAASLSVAIVAVSVGIRLINGDLPLWLGLFVLVLVPDVFLPLRQVGAQFHQAADGLAAAEDLFSLFEHADSTPTPHSRGQLTVAEGETLTLEDVSPLINGHRVTEPVSCEIAPGSLTVMVGPSGAGKTSIVKALLGFTDYEGTFSLNGVACEPGSLRPVLSWAPQNPGLGQGTIEENIVGHTERDQAALTRSVTLAGLSHLDPATVVGVGGAGLSGGQAQRVGLARAYYRALTTTASILLLDEPTAALDDDTEAEVLDGLGTLVAEGFAVVVVSHRDRVLSLPSHTVTVTPYRVESGVV